jgi:hypothetical protein
MIEVLKQMVEALREDRAFLESNAPQEIWDKNNDAISAGRQAIAEMEKQEPVACGHCNGSGRMMRDPDIGTDQECFVCEGSGVFKDTSPQPRKPLTEKDIEGIIIEMNGNEPTALFWIALVRMIEAKHEIGDKS